MSNEFRFVKDPHGYWLGNEQLESPSSVFQDLALVDPRWFTQESRERGHAVHVGLHYALKGRLNWASLHPDLHGWVKSGLLLVDRLKPTIIEMETPRFHAGHRFAGTLDIRWLLQGWEWVVDWKSGKAGKVAKYQTAAYDILAGPTNDGRPRKRAAFELQQDGTIARLVEYDGATDRLDWLCMLAVARIRKALRAKDLSLTQGD